MRTVYSPSVGDSFAVLGYGDHIGEFVTIETVGLDPAFEIEMSYGATTLIIVILQR